DLKIDVVYPSSSLTRRNTLRETLPLVKNPYFIHVGVMEKRKNLTTLVRAFAGLVAHPEFQHYQLVLVGQPGPRKELDAYDDIIAEIQQYYLQEKVVLTG